jgi:hypothetical protein
VRDLIVQDSDGRSPALRGSTALSQLWKSSVTDEDKLRSHTGQAMLLRVAGNVAVRKSLGRCLLSLYQTTSIIHALALLHT